jgi:hypothetical protein
MGSVIPLAEVSYFQGFLVGVFSCGLLELVPAPELIFNIISIGDDHLTAELLRKEIHRRAEEKADIKQQILDYLKAIDSYLLPQT